LVNQTYVVEDIAFSEDEHTKYKNKILQHLFRRVRIKAFASGSNAHTLPVDEEVLKRCADTIYNQPILWKYNPYMDDAMSHEDDEVPCGFVPKEGNPIEFVNENGKTYLVINALIWTRYCGRLIDIFNRDGNSKDVSVELHCNTIEHEDGDEIVDYVITGITILGEWINPAVKGCKAELLEFSEDRSKYLDIYNQKKNVMGIVNKFSINEKWCNPRRSLLNPILRMANKDALLKEAYLVSDIQHPTTLSCKYPHHAIVDGALALQCQGLYMAFSQVVKDNMFTGAIKEHIVRHYRDLGLNGENYKIFGFSQDIYDTYFRDCLESVGEKQVADIKDTQVAMSETEINNAQDTVVDNASDTQVDNCGGTQVNNADTQVDNCGGSQQMADDDKEDAKKDESTNGEEDSKSDDGKEDAKDKEVDNCNGKKMSELEAKCSELEVECADLKKQNAELEASNKAYMAKFAAMSDYETLKQFKFDTEQKMAQDANMAKMHEVFASIESKGINLSDESKADLEKKFAEYDNIDGWANAVKAFAFDNAESVSDGIIKMPYPNAQPAHRSIWDEL